MSRKYEPFDSAFVSLDSGIHLVEASAGTGKTYAIGMLVLRAVVERNIPLEKILIVTFTRGATEELRARIRARLLEAFVLLEKRELEAEDETLAGWITSVIAPDEAVRRLRIALSSIDLAAIFTIHGFCQRMLSEQAMESGQFFEMELTPDVEGTRLEVVEDFWRERVYGLDPCLCALVLSRYGSPAALYSSVHEIFKGAERVEPPMQSSDAGRPRLLELITSLQHWWREKGEELATVCAEAVASGAFNKGVREEWQSWLTELERFFSLDSGPLPGNMAWLDRDCLAGELNGRKFSTLEKKLDFLADWPLPDHEIQEFLQLIDRFLLQLRLDLVVQLQQEVGRRLRKQGCMGFDDLIHCLAQALRGKTGHGLQEILARRFHMALIDEFQDTDSDQWYIFKRLFGGPEHSLYLIGDPKQAIYRFRGADIHSYFSAKRSADRWLTLEKNYRSHPLLLHELNRLFGDADRPFGLDREELDYFKVKAACREDELDLVADEQSISGMVWCQLAEDVEKKNRDGRWSSSGAGAHFREFTVGEIGRLLDRKQPVTLGQGGSTLSPKDIAILVRSRQQAQEYRQRLAELGIPVVSSSNLSVYQSQECDDLLLVMCCLHNPTDRKVLKAVLTLPWFGLSGDELEQNWNDEEWLSELQNRFVGYTQLWQEAGFLSMMNGLLLREKVFSCLAEFPMAERRIVNIRHLIELTGKEEVVNRKGPGELLSWLRGQKGNVGNSQEAELLLESDEDAVKIITMHAAKGLEYPVVFCPFLWYAGSRITREKQQIICYDEGRVLDLGSSEFDRRKLLAEHEVFTEELRLAYVALTRAKCLCYCMWADVKKHIMVNESFASPLGHLLFELRRPDFTGQSQELLQRAQNRGVRYQLVHPDENAVCGTTSAEEMALYCLRRKRTLSGSYQRTSFSALAGLTEEEELEDALVEGQVPIPIRGLPAGSAFGNVVHDLLEHLPFGDIGTGHDYTREISLACNRYGVDAQSEQLLALLRQVVATPLLYQLEEERDTSSFRLADLNPADCLTEMSFCFQLSAFATDGINDLLAAEEVVAPLGYRTLQGYMTGFVDLICRHDGRYFLMDYKSNHLGEWMEQYAGRELIRAMRGHNYGLQYWIYSLVLHRFLQRNLEDYRYEDHFGGVFYLFLRGMSPQLPASGVYRDRPRLATIEALGDILGGGLQ